VVRDRKNESKEVLLASDHAGFKLKQAIKNFLFKRGIIVRDLGTKNTSSVDYPVYAHILSKKINKNKNQFGILVCGSGVGMSITANKYKNVRAALCHNIKSAKLSRQHNNANIIALGSRLINKKIALKCISVFLKTPFERGRHLRRIKKI
tara:strand:+ start:411 stop:860 length:450 start_codon:yes stop_codon:yes gene_type:complete